MKRICDGATFTTKFTHRSNEIMTVRKGITIGIILIVALGFLGGVLRLAENRQYSYKEEGQPKGETRQFTNSMERVILKTSDGVVIAGDYYPGTGDRAVLLLHMMPATRQSWWRFVPRLAEKGYHVLAIDLRGHGESWGGPDGYKKFSDVEHQASIRDVEAAIEFLKGKTPKPTRFVVVGASIGANLALTYTASHDDVKEAVLLSPGLNYRGVRTEPSVPKLRIGQRVFFATSEDDGTNAEETKTLYALVPQGVDKKIVIYQRAGHGTDMLENEQPELGTEIVNWLL